MQRSLLVVWVSISHVESHRMTANARRLPNPGLHRVACLANDKQRRAVDKARFSGLSTSESRVDALRSG
jgi:hypothetical protein